MQAVQSKVEDFLASNKTQFVIPVYQRNYDWTMSQCKQLLDDILGVGTNKKRNAHFIGSIVYIHDDVYTASRIKELTVIDGQQRLTTLTLVYMVIYRLARSWETRSLLAKYLKPTSSINLRQRGKSSSYGQPKIMIKP